MNGELGNSIWLETYQNLGISGGVLQPLHICSVSPFIPLITHHVYCMYCSNISSETGFHYVAPAILQL